VDVVVVERETPPPHFCRQKKKAAQSSKLVQHSPRAGGASSSTGPLANAQDAMADEEDGPVIAPPKRASGRRKRERASERPTDVG
jgi:hypothetical protein